ncbi:MAG: protein kinase [Polyangiales bacterium]
MATPGSLLPGGFVLGRLSHADRVGLVYRAHHAENKDGRAASALVLHPLHVEELREWFEKMAVLGRSLRHPHLVEVYALGYTANELPVVVTEWVDGKTARNELAAGRTFTPGEVGRIIREVASALDYLHRRTPPVLHRVVMPESVLISSPSGAVKLLSVGHADRPQHPAAKPSYLSPEELGNEPNLSPQSDVFSLASLAYELLTGQVAFNGNAHTILAAIYRAAWPRLAPAEGADEVEAVLQTAWQTDPAKRPASAGAFADDLSAALEHLATASASTRRSPSGALRAPTFPAPGGAPPQSPTGRFAAASFHTESIRASRPMAAVARNGASSWSPAPNPSVASPLVVSGTSAYAAAAARVPSSPTPPHGARITGPSPTGSWEAPRAAGRVVEMSRAVLDEDALLADEITLPGDRASGATYTRPSNDDGPAPGALDDLLQRAPRLVDEDDKVPGGAVRLAPRKDPLFVPVDSNSPSNDSWGMPGGIRRNSGEFPPMQRRPTGEFPQAAMPGARRSTGEFAPARRPTGEFPPASAHARRTGEFAQGRRPTGEFPPAPSPTSAPAPRRTGEFAPATPAPTPANALARRTGEFAPSSPASSPPRRTISELPPSRRAVAELPAGDASDTSALSSARSPFERDAFAPAPEPGQRDAQRRGRGEFRVTWPVVAAFLLGNTALTGVVVYGLAQMSSRTPAVVYVERSPGERGAFDPSADPSRAPVQTTNHALPAALPPEPTPPVAVDPVLPTPAVLPAPVAQPAVAAPEAPPSAPAVAPVAAAPTQPAPAVAPTQPAQPTSAQAPVRPWRQWRRPAIVRAAGAPAPPGTAAPAQSAPPTQSAPTPPAQTAPAAPPAPTPPPEARPSPPGFGEPPPNPY